MSAKDRSQSVPGSGTAETTGVTVAVAKAEVYTWGEVAEPARSIENSEFAPLGSDVSKRIEVRSRAGKKRRSPEPTRYLWLSGAA